MASVAVSSYPSPMIGGTDKKRKHKLTEQRGRQKINGQINDLKNLLPECKYVITTKASILECAVKSLQRLQTLCNQLMQSNKTLQKENKRLRAELSKYSPSFNFSGEESPREDFNLTLPSILPIPGFQELSQVDGLLGEDDGQFPDLNYSSPQSSPSTFSSPTSYSPASPINEDTGFSSYDDDQEYYKVSKRRMLLVFLFMLPFFLSIDNMGVYPQEVGQGGRTILGNEMNHKETFSYFDLARLIWYIILGMIAVSWFTNCLLWIHGLGKHTNVLASQFKQLFFSQPNNIG